MERLQLQKVFGYRGYGATDVAQHKDSRLAVKPNRPSARLSDQIESMTGDYISSYILI